MRPRTIFLGTPAFAVPSLDAIDRLCDAGILSLVGVVTQPDRQGDRGRPAPPPVKERALAHGVPVLQPARLAGDGLAAVIALRPALLVWAAYGNLIPRALLDAAGGSAVNVHASLLPRWRGAAPVARAILAGDAETGVSLMVGTVGLDAGPVLTAVRTAIGADEDAGALAARLAEIGAALLERELPRYLHGELVPVPQDERGVTWATKLTTADGVLDWARPADELARRVRAMTPEPGAFTTFRGRRLGVARATVAGGAPAAHGVVRVRHGVPHVAAGAGSLRLDLVTPAGKRTMPGADWARGIRDLEGARLPC